MVKFTQFYYCKHGSEKVTGELHAVCLKLDGGACEGSAVFVYINVLVSAYFWFRY